MDINDEAGVSDSFTIDNISQNVGNLIISEINLLSKKTAETATEFEAKILNSGNANLLLSDEIKSAFNKELKEQKSDSITETVSWNQTFKVQERTQTRELKTVSSTNDSIIDSIKFTTAYSEWQDVQSQGDTLYLINDYQSANAKKFNFDAADNEYILSIDLSTTKGELNINGVKDETNLFTINFNDKTGFILDENSTLNFSNVKLTGTKTAITNNGGNLSFKDTNIIESDIVGSGSANNEGTLDINSANIGVTLNNTGSVNIYGDSSLKNINGDGSITIGKSEADAGQTNLVFDNENGIAQKSVTINEKGSVEIYADKLVSDNVTNNNQLTLKAQTSTETNPETNSSSKITGDGTTIIDGGVINSKELIGSKYILINENATLKANADNVGLKNVTETITNNGTVSLNGGTLNSKIDGGKIAMTGNVTTNADNLFGDISNDGELTLTGGTIKKDIAESETGKIVIGDMHSVVNEANVNQKITVNGQYETSADKIYDKDGAITVNSSCELVLNGGTLKENRIEGTGSTMDDVPDLYIKNKVTFAFDNSKYDEKHILSNIDIDETGIFKPADNYSGDNNTILFYDGSTIDLANGQVNTVNLKNLESNQSGDKLFILADYKDSFDSKDVSSFGDANVVIKSLDMSNMQEGDDDSYQFTNGLKDKVKMELEQVKFSDKSDKNSVYYTKDDGKINIKKLSNLEEAIKEVQDNSINMSYQMKTDENLSENKEITNANMSIFGLGTSIKGKSLTVGDGITERNLIISDVSLKNTDLNEGDKYSLIIKDKATAKISAKDYDISIDGNINLQTDDDTTGTGSKKLTLNVDSGRTITLGEQGKENGYIVSDSATNVVTFKGQGADSNIIANGVFDPFIANVENVTLSKNNYDDEITYNLKDGGVLNYSNDLYLFDATKHNGTTYNKNSINFQGGTLNLANNRVNDIQLKNLVLGIRDTALSIAKDSYINVDVDLANRKMDTLNAETVDIVDGSKLNVDMRLISDASSEITAGIKFTDNDALWSAVAVNENKEYTAESPIYRYTVKKGGASASDGFTFTRKGGYHGYNPAMFAPAAALQGVYYTQLNNYDLALTNVDQTMLKTQAQRKAEKFANKYAYDGEETQVFSPLYNQLENNGIWFKPYVSTEKVNLKGGPKVNNTMYGALVGGDSVIMPVKDWDLQYSAYVGYNGSKQSFESNDVSQNGGVVGVTASAYKGNLFSALTVNASIHSTDVKTKFSDNDICMLGAGIASKTGYNFEFKNGKFIIQPSWLMSYTFVNPFSDVTVQGVKVKSESLNAVQLAPGVKFIGNTETGWQPYVGLKMVFNIADETKVKANNVKIPETTTDPYLEYGLGVQKSAGERFTGFGQAMFRGGGRNGAAFTFGGRWAVGSLKAKKN